jgi:hypothetical protein
MLASFAARAGGDECIEIGALDPDASSAQAYCWQFSSVDPLSGLPGYVDRSRRARRMRGLVIAGVRIILHA